jgi:hypothetical protein
MRLLKLLCIDSTKLEAWRPVLNTLFLHGCAPAILIPTVNKHAQTNINGIEEADDNNKRNTPQTRRIHARTHYLQLQHGSAYVE